jgi:hypothetical protein
LGAAAAASRLLPQVLIEHVEEIREEDGGEGLAARGVVVLLRMRQQLAHLREGRVSCHLSFLLQPPPPLLQLVLLPQSPPPPPPTFFLPNSTRAQIAETPHEHKSKLPSFSLSVCLFRSTNKLGGGGRNTHAHARRRSRERHQDQVSRDKLSSLQPADRSICCCFYPYNIHCIHQSSPMPP